MVAPIKTGYRLTQDHYAYVYDVALNTVRRWQARGLPLDEPEVLIRILMRQRLCSRSLRVKGFAAILKDYELLARE
jgi:hypothetical protein